MLASDCGRDNIPTYCISYEMKKYIDFPVGSFGFTKIQCQIKLIVSYWKNK